MKLTWFGHSAFRLDVAGAAIMIDPFLANPTFRGDKAAAFAGATHVVLTHGHGDHVGDTVEICKATGATVIANPEICVWLQAKGVARTAAMNHGGEFDAGPFRVAMVPALHSSSGAGHEGAPVYLGNPAGVVVMPPGEKRVLHMGDTGIFSDMALIHELYSPQVGIVPVGDRFTMGGRQAALACSRYFAFETVVPCHYGTFPMIDQTPEAFIAAMQGSETRVLVPECGVAVDL